ncbi:MAG: alcohol dehydrogenase catalytic domain-containing protein, partial [Planctomycetes bacterium]|nr:alcohol dehydrogenase catalytic domain-containing protein [Planctomycetota bacterium]
MRAIVLDEGGRLDMREVPAPQPGPGQVRVRTAACGVCATDLEMIDGDPRVCRPAILGHEWAGVVDAAGPGADAALVGRPCVAENVLADGGEVGFEHPGGYGEMLVTEAANVHLLPEGLAPAAAALIEPLAVAVRAVGRLA